MISDLNHQLKMP